jgi:hypothetical protein
LPAASHKISRAAGWALKRLLSDNANEFKGVFIDTVTRLKARHTPIHAGRPQTNGNVKALHKTILDEGWRPAFARYIYPRLAGLRRELNTYLNFYNHDRIHHGHLTRGRIPTDIVYGARKMKARSAAPVGTSRSPSSLSAAHSMICSSGLVARGRSRRGWVCCRSGGCSGRSRGDLCLCRRRFGTFCLAP